MKRKKLGVILAVIFLLLVGGYVIVCSRSSQDDMYPDKTDGKLCYVPILTSPAEVELYPGLRFKIDTGSDLSTITESDLAILDSLNYKVKKSWYPVFGRDGAGKIRVTTTRYTVELPMIVYDIVTDSLGIKHGVGYKKKAKKLHNVDFTPSGSGMSVLGIDFIEKFKLEYDFRNRAIALYLSDPDTTYLTCTELYSSRSPLIMPMLAKRYSLDMTAAGYEGSFFIDTGIEKAKVKMPYNDAAERHRAYLEMDTVETTLGLFPALVNRKAVVRIGDRVGLGDVYFYESLEEDYAFNPFNLFLQNILIDFPGRKLKLFPVYQKDKTLPPLVSDIAVVD